LCGCGGGNGRVGLREDLVGRLGRPGEGVGDLIPFGDECEQGLLEDVEVGEVRRAEALALARLSQNRSAEPHRTP